MSEFIEFIKSRVEKHHLFGIRSVQELSVSVRGFLYLIEHVTNNPAWGDKELNELNQAVRKKIGWGNIWDRAISYEQIDNEHGLSILREVIPAISVVETNEDALVVTTRRVSVIDIVAYVKKKINRQRVGIQSVRDFLLFYEGIYSGVLLLRNNGIIPNNEDFGLSILMTSSFNEMVCKKYKVDKPWNYATIYDACHTSSEAAIQTACEDIESFVATGRIKMRLINES